MNGEFKIITTPAWTKPEIGSCEFKYDDKAKMYKATAEMSMNGADNMKGIPEGVWAMTFDMNTKAIEATEVTALEFIGDATGGWGDARCPAASACDNRRRGNHLDGQCDLYRQGRI